MPDCVILFALWPLRYVSLGHAFLCGSHLHYAYLHYGSLYYASLCYASFCDGHLRKRFFAIQLWIDAFMIWTILFQILIIESFHRYTPIVSTKAVAVAGG